MYRRMVLARFVALVVGVTLFLLALPWVVRAEGLPNSWIGLRTFSPTTGVLAYCSISSQPSVSFSSVWSAVTGEASLDIIQIGAMAYPDGRVRYFAAWGRGEPFGAGSLYEERDLGPANRLPHKYTVQLVNGAWSLSIDGRTRLRVPDEFRTWTIRQGQVMFEVGPNETRMGGATCLRARACINRTWELPSWSLSGNGPAAMNATIRQGADWFRVY